MSMRQSTLCTIIQGFPVLLIIAQNNYRCLQTPLIYKPPAPTASPEYIEALNTLYQSLYHSHGHEYGNHDYGGGYGGSYGYGQGSYGHGSYGQGSYGNFGGFDSKPNHNFHGVTYKPYEYPSVPGNHGYPGFFYKKGFNATGQKGYAPNQIYKVKNKYKIVLKRTKGHKKSQKIRDETCQTVDNEIGSCISILSCEPYLRVVKESRSNPQAVQLLRRAHCGFEGNNPKVCCPRPGIPTVPPQPTTTTTTTTTPPPTPPPEEPTEGKSVGEYLDAFPSPPICGKAGGSVGRVVGGEPARLGAFPWMALLGYKPKRGGAGARWLCGGSLVSSRHVVTAAHCIHLMENSLFLVRLGELDLASETDGATPVDVLIKKMMKHEQYNHKSHANDIGLLLLDKDVQFTALIRPICLPQESEYRAQTFEKYSPMIAGWGAIEYRGPSATHLQVIQLPVVSNNQCSQAYSNYPIVNIDQTIICAGLLKGGKDACQGDSGGPLMQPLYNTTTNMAYYYQIGVVSFGKKCAEPGFPGVYSRLTHYIPWLQEKMLGSAK